jgi:hypothetical protein
MQVRETRLESHDGARDSRARKVSPGASSLTRVLRKKPIGLFHATKVDFSRKWALAADEPGYRSTEKYRATKDSLQFRNVLRKGRRDLGAARHNHPLRRPLPVTEPRLPPSGQTAQAHCAVRNRRTGRKTSAEGFTPARKSPWLPPQTPPLWHGSLPAAGPSAAWVPPRASRRRSASLALSSWVPACTAKVPCATSAPCRRRKSRCARPPQNAAETGLSKLHDSRASRASRTLV